MSAPRPGAEGVSGQTHPRGQAPRSRMPGLHPPGASACGERGRPLGTFWGWQLLGRAGEELGSHRDAKAGSCEPPTPAWVLVSRVQDFSQNCRLS